MIAGVGVDIIDVARIEAAIARHGRRFVERVFTDEEIRYCSSRSHAVQHYAGRFAAKEAVLKVLGTGWGGGIGWTDVEVRAGNSRAPEVRLRGKAREAAESATLGEIRVSISHTSSMAIAVAAAERANGQ
jgi:holo-[acyl-carrier protein] synthase